MGHKLKNFLSKKFTVGFFGNAKHDKRPSAPLLAATAFAVALTAPGIGNNAMADTAPGEPNATTRNTTAWGPTPAFNRQSAPPPYSPGYAAQPEPVNPVLHEYLDQRIVRITGNITEESAAKTIGELRMLDDHNPDNQDIELRIHSAGGSVTAAFAIYDAVKNLKSDVRTVCEGTAQSMGAFLLATGTPGKRTSLPHCRIMIHQPWGGTQGQITNMKIQVEEGQKLKNMKINIMAAYAGLEPQSLARLMERDMFLSAADAQELGLIDKIMAPEKQTPDYGKRRAVPARFFNSHQQAARISPSKHP